MGNRDGFISNGDLFQVMKMMVGDNLTDEQLQQLVDRQIRNADKDYDGLISFQEFKDAVKDVGCPVDSPFLMFSSALSALELRRRPWESRPSPSALRILALCWANC